MKALKIEISDDTYERFKYLKSVDDCDDNSEIEILIREAFEEQKRIDEIIEHVKNS